MSSWINITARLAVLPTIVAGFCAAIPHWIFTRSDIDVARTMTLIAVIAWSVTALGFLAVRQWLSLAALAIATLSVLMIWGGHVLIAYESFRMYIGLPTVLDFAMAALWWGVYFSILFAALYPLHRCQQFKPPSGKKQLSPHPGMELVTIFAIVNFGFVAVIAVITVTTGSYQISFPTLATLHLPLQTIKDWARPGMGSVSHLPASMMLYAVFGSAFQCGLAWFVCRVGFAAGIIAPSTHSAPQLGQGESG